MMSETRRPIVLEKIQFESRRVFSTNNRKMGIEERANNGKNMHNALFKSNSFFEKRARLINELPPHPRKVILPVIENQIIFLGGVALSLLHKDIVGNFKKNMIDFMILRSFFGIGILFFLLFEVYTLKLRIKMMNSDKTDSEKRNNLSYTSNVNKKGTFLSLSRKSKITLLLWMIISSIVTISQPLINLFFPRQIVSLSQPFIPLLTLTMFFLLTYRANKKITFESFVSDKIGNKSDFQEKNDLSDGITETINYKIVEQINIEAEKLSQRSRIIASYNISLQNVLVIFLAFFSLYFATPVKGIIIYLKDAISLYTILSGLILTLIIPCLHDILFHFVCNIILKELLVNRIDFNPDNNWIYSKNSRIDDLKRKLCNVYIHIFMTLGQIFIVLPACLGIKAIFYSKFVQIFSNNNNIDSSTLWLVINSIFDIDKKDLMTIVFSAVSMLGIYQRCKITNAESFGVTGLITVQGFQTLLSTSIKRNLSIWLNDNFFSLLISFTSLFILKIQDVIGTIKILCLYFKWILYFRKEMHEKVNYISEQDYIKYYKSNIRVIGGSFGMESSVTASLLKTNKSVIDNSFIEDDVSLKSDNENEHARIRGQKKAESLYINKKKLTKGAVEESRDYIGLGSNDFVGTPIMSAKVVLLQNL
ncbi:putative integral membrane protein [Cryptosporidium felis]|nr:putative integral membrane protein [Cryptosporidium felis]